MKQFHVIVVGATGAVGRFLVSQLLENSSIKSVTIFVRKNIIYADKFHTEGAGILTSVTWSSGLIRLGSKVQYIKKYDNLDFLPYESFL